MVEAESQGGGGADNIPASTYDIWRRNFAVARMDTGAGSRAVDCKLKLLVECVVVADPNTSLGAPASRYSLETPKASARQAGPSRSVCMLPRYPCPDPTVGTLC